jgi:AcrR family transcriptional regulator
MAERPYHHGDLKSALISLATAQIARSGAESLSVRALAREAGVAHRAAYQHFPDKDSLLAAALAAAYDRLATRLDAARDRASSPRDQLLAVASAYGAFAVEEPNVFLAMAGPRINAAGAFADLETAIARAWRHVAGPIAAGVERGDFTLADKTAAAAIFWCGLSGVLTQAAQGRLKLAPEKRAALIALAAERLLAGLAA